jgi:hypothetical protein
MFKLAGLLGLSYFSLSREFQLPRLTHTEADFFLMPLIGYLLLLLLPWADHLCVAPFRRRRQKVR